MAGTVNLGRGAVTNGIRDEGSQLHDDSDSKQPQMLPGG